MNACGVGSRKYSICIATTPDRSKANKVGRIGATTTDLCLRLLNSPKFFSDHVPIEHIAGAAKLKYPPHKRKPALGAADCRFRHDVQTRQLSMQHRRFGHTDLMVSVIGLGCYGMSGVYGPADDAESIATIHRALDLGVNFFDTSTSYGQGHNHGLIGQALRGRRHEAVIHSKSGSPRDGAPGGVRGGGDPRYLRQTCEQSLQNLGIEALDVFCMSRVDPNVPVEESVGAMAELVKEGKTRFISLSECSAESLRRGSAVHPLASLQMEYSLFSRDAEEQGQIEACKELGMAMMAYAVLGRGILSAAPPEPRAFTADDIRARLPRFDDANLAENLRLCSALGVIAHRKNATLAQ